MLTGGQGNDTLDGAGGADTIAGGEGDDTIAARDGVADAIDCGVGNDTATVDALDTVSGCETVVRPDDDLDGIVAPLDCDDADPTVHPGAADTPGDGIDQDCSGADTPAPAQPVTPKPAPAGLPPTGRVTVTQITAPVRNRWLVKRRSTKVTGFSVSGRAVRRAGHGHLRRRRLPVREAQPPGPCERQGRLHRRARGPSAEAGRGARDPHHRARLDRQGRPLRGPQRQAAEGHDALPRAGRLEARPALLTRRAR